MSLNTVTSGLGGPVSKTTDAVQNTVDQTTKPVTDTIQSTTSSIPCTFPRDEQPTNTQNNVTVPSISELWVSFIAWVKCLIPRGVDIFEAAVRRFIQWLIPPERQIALYKASMEHPIAATFVICQLICVGIPLVLFVAGTLLFAAVAMLVWVLLSLLILGPIMLVASLMGVSLWGWGWFVFGLVRWLDKLMLGGMMERFWWAQIQQQKEEEESQVKQEGEEDFQKETNDEKRDD
ncbi:hypothetical protein BDW62DRAFT_195351 [Aspergillus aurantiobrunneus]